jgi:hypothetical protein
MYLPWLGVSPQDIQFKKSSGKMPKPRLESRRASCASWLRGELFVRLGQAHKKRKLPPWLGSFLFCFEA